MDIQVDLEMLSQRLGVPAVGISAGRREGLDDLLDAVCRVADGALTPDSLARRAGAEERATLAQRYAGRWCGAVGRITSAARDRQTKCSPPERQGSR